MASQEIKKAFLSAGDLAKYAGVSTDTLRHYERKRVLAQPLRAANGYRRYPPEALDRVLLVRRALALGFTLDELARFLSARDRGGVPCEDVRALAAVKLTELEQRLAQMIELRGVLRATLDDWDDRLEKKRDGGQAGLLDSLPSRSNLKANERAGVGNNRLRRKRKTSDE